MTIYTVGHSNRTLEFLITLLQGRGISRLVDLRTIPRSRHNPQFNKDTLPSMLKVVGIDYTHMRALGGLRSPRKDSPNQGWTNNSFRGFADYMQTADFDQALRKLVDLGKGETLAIMCAEAVPWRCHRSLVADALTARGVGVRHIMSRVSAPKHERTSFAQVHGMRVTYPGKQPGLPFLAAVGGESQAHS
jgi:uncharacterized protein (DUF488 family)